MYAEAQVMHNPSFIVFRHILTMAWFGASARPATDVYWAGSLFWQHEKVEDRTSRYEIERTGRMKSGDLIHGFNHMA